MPITDYFTNRIIALKIAITLRLLAGTGRQLVWRLEKLVFQGVSAILNIGFFWGVSMLRKFFIVAILLGAAPAIAQTDQRPTDAPAVPARKVPKRVICEDIGETGSRLGAKRVCMTFDQWSEQRRNTQDDVRAAQHGLAGTN